MSEGTSPGATAPGFQWWMVANFAMGAGFSAFVALLIPPYVNEVTGDAAAAGVVMAIISLAAVLGPVAGTLADRYRAHRLLLSGGVLGMAVGFGAFALSAESSNLYALDAILIGTSMAALSAVGPVFVVGARLPKKLEARRMTAYSLAMPAGQVVGGAIIGVAANAGWSFSDRFWIAAAVMFAVFVVTWMTSKGPERVLHAAMYGSANEAAAADDDDSEAATGGSDEKKSMPLKALLFSSFGVFLLVSVLTSMANNGINNQISNIMPNVYGISEAETSTLISAAGLLNILLFFPAGKLMAKRGAFDVYSLGVVLRLVGALGMALVGLVSDSPVLLAVGFMQILYQANPFARLAQPGTAVGFATVPAGIANGWLIAASAMGSFLGSVLGGVFADKWGFNSVNWMGFGAASASLVVLVLGLWPKRGGMSERDPGPDATAKAQVHS